MGEQFYRNQAYRRAGGEFMKVLALEPDNKGAKKYLDKCLPSIEREVARGVSVEEVVTPDLTLSEGEIAEEREIELTPLPEGARVIRSIDVLSGVKVEVVEGKMRVTLTLSGEREYTVDERAKPPSIIIDIPRTISAVSPATTPINKGHLKMIKTTQYRSLSNDRARVMVILNRRVEYRVTHKNSEIYIDFE